MKRIVITEIHPPEKIKGLKNHRHLRNKYRIDCPYCDYNFYFSSKRKAEQFAAAFSRSLTRSLYDVNFFLADLYKIYRQLWPYDPLPKIPDLFSYIDNRFPYLLQKDDIYLCFGSFATIFSDIKEIISILKHIAEKNKIFALLSHLKSMENYINSVAENVMNYGKNNPARLDNDPKKLS